MNPCNGFKLIYVKKNSNSLIYLNLLDLFYTKNNLKNNFMLEYKHQLDKSNIN